MIIKDAKRIFNSDKICCRYCDFYFGVTFLEHTVVVFDFPDMRKRRISAKYICAHQLKPLPVYLKNVDHHLQILLAVWNLCGGYSEKLLNAARTVMS